MKILFAGDASNMHHTLSQALRRMGHEAVVASDGSRWMNTRRDIDLTRRDGTWGAVRYMCDIARNLPRMRGFDVVHIAGHIFLRLRPEKVRMVFDYLKRHNGKIVLSALGTDHVYWRACHDGHTFRYSDYMIGDKPSPYVGSEEYHRQQQDNWNADFMRRHSDHIVSNIDGAVACLYEYYAAYEPILGDRVAYAGLPIDCDALQPVTLDHEPQKVRFFIGIQPDRDVIKGTDRLLAAARRVVAERPDECELEVATRLPYAEYVDRMRSCHVILDQLYSYTPATNALIAMAQGLTAVSGAEPEYYDLIGEHDLQPIVNVLPESDADIEHCLHGVVDRKSELPTLSKQSREFVVKHNDAHIVAQRYVDFWQTL